MTSMTTMTTRRTPRPPLGKYPQLALWGHAGNAPTSSKITMTRRMVEIIGMPFLSADPEKKATGWKYKPIAFTIVVNKTVAIASGTTHLAGGEAWRRRSE
jgi:hypothetical protein